jgi:crossover junction endodeoxyribonuclease RuvC
VAIEPAKKDGAVVIVGVDPGTVVTGWGAVQMSEGVLRHLGHGTIRLSSAEPQAIRLSRIYQGLGQVLREYRPDGMSLEKLFFAKNVQSALKLGQARGVALLAAAEHGVEVHEYTAAEIKSAVVGFGRATKPQVQMMIAALLSMAGRVPADASDALAAAICHLHRRSFQARLAEVAPAPLRPGDARARW